MKTVLTVAACAALFAFQSVSAKDPAATPGGTAPATAPTAKDARAKQSPLKETEQERKDRLLAQFDANKDGKLDAKEKSALKASIQEDKAKRRGKGDEQDNTTVNPNALGAGASQNAGGNNLSNASPQMKQMLARFDVNRDGQLSPLELQAAQQAMQGQLNGLTPQQALQLKMGFGGRNLPPGKIPGNK